jgi:negative regulator of flagellin synthesis FlgM
VPAKITGYPTPESIAPLKGTSTGGITADKSQTDAAAVATSQTGDHVTLTSSARSLQRLSDAISQVPVVDASKVASIKNAVSSGTYKVDAASVADKLLHFDSTLK